jgi:hypothetical protein
MRGLDSLLMSDFEVWTMLAALGAATLAFIPLRAPARPPRRRTPTKLTLIAFLVVATLGGLAWYEAPVSPTAASVVSDAGHG